MSFADADAMPRALTAKMERAMTDFFIGQSSSNVQAFAGRVAVG
jgi:hypothetical protein